MENVVFGKNRTLKVVEENGLYYVKNYLLLDKEKGVKGKMV